MRRVYFDSAAIVKLVHAERESMALLQFLESPVEAFTSIVSEVEVRRALRRHGCEAGDVDEALGGFFVLAFHRDIRRRAVSLDPLTLRSLDAIHLATALSLGDPDLELATYDDRLAVAARAHGLRVVQPGPD